MKYMIAVVEDNSAEADTLKSFLRRYAGEASIEFDIKWFTDGSAFLSGYQPVYDLVLMDISLPGINGMDVAVRLRAMDEAVPLIFVTSLARYAIRGYEVDAMGFLIKPVSYPNFALKLQRALARSPGSQNPGFLISIPDGVYRISPSRILYVETAGHTLIYHTTEGIIRAPGLLKEVETRLDSKQFVRCNRCYLINLAFVRAVRGYTLVVGEDELQISRPKKAAFLAALNDYLGGVI